MVRSKKKTIWFLEDDPLFAFLLQHKFDKELDFRFEWFESYNRMLARIKSGKEPDIFVLDDKLVGITSLQVIDKIRQTKCQKPVISLTSNTEMPRALELLAAGVDSYIKKSEYCYDELISEIRRTLKL